MTDEPSPLASKHAPAWKIAANLLLFLGLVAIFAWQVKKNQHAIIAFHWSVNWELAVTALLLLLMCSTADILIWNRTLSWFTAPLPFRKAAPVYIWSFLARYLPFKVGSLILRVALAAEVQREPVPVLAASVVELALRIASGLLIFLAALCGWGFAINPRLRLASLVIVPLVLICAHPRVMLPVMNWALRKIKQPPLARSVRYGEVLGVFAMLLLRWIVYGLSYAALVIAFDAHANSNLPVLIGCASGAWAAGFILMTPAGLGAAELIQKAILGALHVPAALTTILPILARLWTLAGEGIWSLAAWGLWARRAAPSPPTPLP